MENLTGDKLLKLRNSFNLTQTECANLLYIHLRTWQYYEKSEKPMPQAYQELLLFKLNRIKQNETNT